jgi:hypothetical protein
MLSPLSPLLVGLDESNANRSRGSAYWRRARMCLRIASIADYWQVQSRDGPGAGARMGTPQPGHRKPPIAPPPPPSGLQASPAPPPPVASGEEDLGNLGPRLQALARKVDHAVTEAVACTLLKISLQDGKDPLPMTGNEEPPKTALPLRRTPSQCAALAAVASARADRLAGKAQPPGACRMFQATLGPEPMLGVPHPPPPQALCKLTSFNQRQQQFG